MKQGDNNVSAVIQALLRPGDWFLLPEELDRLKSICPHPSCQSQVASAAQSLRLPVTIGLDGPIRIGLFEVSARDEIVQVLRHFPPGTEFRLQQTSRMSSWLYQKRLNEVKAAFATAGIELREIPR